MSTTESSAKLLLSHRWLKQYKAMVELDEWGQREEASELYQKLADDMARERERSDTEWTKNENDAVAKFAVCLRLRSYEVNKIDVDGITLENIKALAKVLECLFRTDKKFPIDLSSVKPEDLEKAQGADLTVMKEIMSNNKNALGSKGVSGNTKILSKNAPNTNGVSNKKSMTINRIQKFNDDDGNSSEDDNDDEAEQTSIVESPMKSLSSPQGSIKKFKRIQITVNKIGMKDEKTAFVDPRISVYLVSTNQVTGVQQDSQVSSQKDGKHFVFSDSLTLQQAYESILPGSAVIFEFRHFKQSKNKISTKCWAFLEREEIKEGLHVLELYKKPVNLKRKNIRLLTTKSLYLHISINFVPV